MNGILLALWLAASPAPDCPPPVDHSLARALHIQDLELIRSCLAAGASAATTSERGKTTLMAAAGAGDMTLLEAMLKAGVDPDARNGNGGTALMYAAAKGRVEAIQRLNEAGADPTPVSTNGWSALTVAAAKGRPIIVKLLAARGADPNVRDIRGWTPLMHAAFNGYPDAVESLLELPDIDVQADALDGFTALHAAVASGLEHSVRLLLDHGADRRAQTREGETPEGLARRLGYDRLATLVAGRQG